MVITRQEFNDLMEVAKSAASSNIGGGVQTDITELCEKIESHIENMDNLNFSEAKRISIEVCAN